MSAGPRPWFAFMVAPLVGLLFASCGAVTVEPFFEATPDLDADGGTDDLDAGEDGGLEERLTLVVGAVGFDDWNEASVRGRLVDFEAEDAVAVVIEGTFTLRFEDVEPVERSELPNVRVWADLDGNEVCNPGLEGDEVGIFEGEWDGEEPVLLLDGSLDTFTADGNCDGFPVP